MIKEGYLRPVRLFLSLAEEQPCCEACRSSEGETHCVSPPVIPGVIICLTIPKYTTAQVILNSELSRGMSTHPLARAKSFE